MTDPRFAIHSIADPSGATVYLYLRGVFEPADHRELRIALRGAFRRSRRCGVVIDVADVAVLADECVDVLLLAYTRALRGGFGYEVVNARGETRQQLQAAGLCPRDPAVADVVEPAAADLRRAMAEAVRLGDW